MFLAKRDSITEQLCAKLLKEYNGENAVVPLMIFGSGKWGKYICQIMLNRGLRPQGFVDNNSEKWDMMECGIKVFSPTELEVFNGLVLIMVREHSQEILEQINTLGNPDLKCICWEELVRI